MDSAWFDVNRKLDGEVGKGFCTTLLDGLYDIINGVDGVFFNLGDIGILDSRLPMLDAACRITREYIY
jgi:hypothetical protein